MEDTRLWQKRRLYSLTLKAAMLLSAAITVGLVLFIIVYVVWNGAQHLSWELLTTSPSYLTGNIGILPDILNTLYMVITTLAVVLPIGIGAAIYLTEYANHPRLISWIEFTTETLSGIPSIIFGLVGMLAFAQMFGFGTSILAGALTLVMMNLPIIIRTTQESLKTVPNSYREGAFALGAGKSRVVFTVVLPKCVAGIVSGTILTIGRILGETAALLYTAGLAHVATGYFSAIFKSGATLTVSLYVYAKEQGEFQVAFAIATILLILTFIINQVAYQVTRLSRTKE
ncbi:phosphate ABC transporter permease PstA [Streptococcus moroccensis]|uniref:Phosphate transport system permease protein PstA n=1 Tax=Streptococcus moroccensis TaxID=1451356 RepID=A0ABT9YPL8_9STRE|nr:phosphate ABC transporter permease PstA [Streptococcus moroccensis]MDQ0221941.1 phosphate transport system permease protein [Streptococcus moroccensis]